MPVLHSHRDLLVWQRSMKLITTVYALTDQFPRSEVYRLTDQMRRSCISISSNIAEGRRRRTRNEFIHFLFIAYASAAELDTQIDIADQLSFGDSVLRKTAKDDLQHILRMINAMITALRQKPRS